MHEINETDPQFITLTLNPRAAWSLYTTTNNFIRYGHHLSREDHGKYVPLAYLWGYCGGRKLRAVAEQFEFDNMFLGSDNT